MTSPETPVSRSAAFVAVVLVALVHAETSIAHDFSITEVVAVVKADGTYQIDIRINVDALALGVSAAHPSPALAAGLRALSPDEMARALQQARDTMMRRVRVRFDGRKVVPAVAFPEYEHPSIAADSASSAFGATARLLGRYPDGATTFTFGASRAFSAIQLTILNEVTAGGAKYVLGAGEDTPPYHLHESNTNTSDGAIVVGRYMVLGFEHILPKGLDHILFVLGLYLLTIRIRPLLLQISAFTVAHSVTLGLSMAGVVSLPSRIVEPLIALSIMYVAVENLCVRDLRPWRPAVVFLFGLLHGMGFAGVLRELGMPQGQFASALVGFNIGVEFGQLTIVMMAFLVLGWFRNRRWYRNAIIRPLSLAIALVGAYWVFVRTWGVA